MVGLKNSQILIDASFLLKLLLPEEKSEQAERLWREWIEDSLEIIAPTLVVFETSSVIRNKLYREIIDEEDADRLITQLKELDITLTYTEDILGEAWEISKILNSSTPYVCFYIALSKFLNIPMWTADGKLYNLAKKYFHKINLLQ
jgi:predicted nucleic acid-binding protein